METKRLTIRRFLPEDWPDLFEYLSQEDVVKYEPYDAFTREQAEQEAIRRTNDPAFWAVCLRDVQSPKLIGNIYLARQEFATWELGYVFNSCYWGKGFAMEAASGLLDELFTGSEAHRVIAVCNPLNESSWRLLERLGMRREGCLRKNIWFFKDKNGDPIWQDTYEYAILREEWCNLNGD